MVPESSEPANEPAQRNPFGSCVDDVLSLASLLTLVYSLYPSTFPLLRSVLEIRTTLRTTLRGSEMGLPKRYRLEWPARTIVGRPNSAGRGQSASSFSPARPWRRGGPERSVVMLRWDSDAPWLPWMSSDARRNRSYKNLPTSLGFEGSVWDTDKGAPPSSSLPR